MYVKLILTSSQRVVKDTNATFIQGVGARQCDHITGMLAIVSSQYELNTASMAVEGRPPTLVGVRL